MFVTTEFCIKRCSRPLWHKALSFLVVYFFVKYWTLQPQIAWQPSGVAEQTLKARLEAKMRLVGVKQGKGTQPGTYSLLIESYRWTEALGQQKRAFSGNDLRYCHQDTSRPANVYSITQTLLDMPVFTLSPSPFWTCQYILYHSVPSGPASIYSITQTLLDLPMCTLTPRPFWTCQCLLYHPAPSGPASIYSITQSLLDLPVFTLSTGPFWTCQYVLYHPDPSGPASMYSVTRILLELPVYTLPPGSFWSCQSLLFDRLHQVVMINANLTCIASWDSAGTKSKVHPPPMFYYPYLTLIWQKIQTKQAELFSFVPSFWCMETNVQVLRDVWGRGTHYVRTQHRLPS